MQIQGTFERKGAEMRRNKSVSELMRLRRIHSLTTGFLCFKTFVFPS